MRITPTNQTVNWFRELNTLGLINFSPDFQRRYVWSEKQKVYLIDTLINDFSVPKIYIRQILDEKTNTNKYEVVDGQQRLTTIMNFINGEFALFQKKHPKPDFFDEKLEGKYFNNLELTHKQKILNFSMSVDLIEGSKEEIIEMFLRLNLSNTTLNKQEILNSQYFGDFKILVEKITDEFLDEFVEDKILAIASIKRMADYQLVSMLLVAQLFGITDKDKRIQKVYSDYDSWEEDEARESQIQFRKIYNLITKNIFDGHFGNSRFKSLNGFYSIFEYMHEKIFKQNMTLDSSNHVLVKDTLQWLSKEMKMDGIGLGKEWFDLTQQGGDTSNARTQRKQILSKLLDVFFTNTDPKRAFTDEERIIAWNASLKVCGICKNEIKEFKEYDLDHIVPHSKGGKTNLNNSQLTHSSCNRAKGNRIQ
jgi:uncharacterized protein with ParB-like and HNH nuclease domain